MGQAASTDKIQIDGFCEKQFEPVKEHLMKMLTKGKEENVQLCVYVDGNCVIDLYGTAVGDKNYNQEKLQNIFSSGKSLEAIAMAVLYDKGLFEYDDKISKYWPEFAQNGKEDVKICDVLRHESGLAYFQKDSPSCDDLKTSNIKLNKVGEIIEKEELHYPEYLNSSSKRDYHGITRGMILNEIIRRVDPKGRTMSEIFREEINIDGILLGLNDTELEKCVPMSSMTTGFILKQMLTPSWAGRKVSQSPMDLIKMISFFAGVVKEMERRKNVTELDANKAMEGMVNIACSAPWRQAEISSANFQANARGSAKLASIMALKGESLMSQTTWEEMHSEQTTADMLKLGSGAEGECRTNFTKGGVNFHLMPKDIRKSEIGLNQNREGYYGWMGYGGSIVQWHPELKIGFAFIPTYISNIEMTNERGGVLQQIVKDCCTKTSATE